MALLMNTNLAKMVIDFSSPSDCITKGLLGTAGAAKLRCDRLAQQNKTPINCLESAVYNGVSGGILAGAVPAVALLLAPRLWNPFVLPGTRSIASAYSLTRIGIATFIDNAAKQWVCAPLLNRAEQLKNEPMGLGAVLQGLALGIKLATLWYTELPRLAVSAVCLSAAIVCGAIGAIGGLLYYCAMSGPEASGRGDVGAAPLGASDEAYVVPQAAFEEPF